MALPLINRGLSVRPKNRNSSLFIGPSLRYFRVRRPTMLTTPVPSSLSERQRSILELLLNHVAQIPGVAAIVIGGSHARGTARSDSDVDVGLYYHAANLFPIDQLISAEGFRSD